VWKKFTNVSEVRAASIIRAMMKAARTSKTLVKSYKSTRRCNPEVSHLHFLFASTLLLFFLTISLSSASKGSKYASDKDQHPI
jgi:hypothetical protein